ncbi:MAG TPA: secretin N-terminal domain-containing protein [Pyrinomonadaceae bacterium]|nr:secretin N-terminal domain-containing protein [Pyrinomonadaceae bacterium]
MKTTIHQRSIAALLIVFCLLATPVAALGSKGEKNFKRGLQYEAAQQWEKAAQEFTLAIAAEPSNLEYQLHYRRAVFNASQALMQQGRALALQHDYVGAYNAFRQAYGYDPVNQLALSEMERMLRLQREKDGTNGGIGENNGSGQSAIPSLYGDGNGAATGSSVATPSVPSAARSDLQDPLPPARTEQLRVINYSGDLKSFIRSLADQLNLNVIFDSQSFRQPRTIDINLKDVTTAQALDYIFLQEGLFFQKLSRRTVLVADQTRRPQYQQLVIRTFYLSNVKPQDARNLIVAAIPPQQGRPQTIVIPDEATNSLTVRDTAENIRLIGDIIQSIDKDRAEVVMDVNIYEVSRTDLMQFGNQLGTDTQLSSLGGASALSVLGGSRQVAQQVFNAPTALGAALVFPPSTISALQRKDRTRLVASTQVHAFNGEESTARIGQRVPVQTAQVPYYGNQPTTTPTTPGLNPGLFGNGYPVIQFEPTGLTLKFTPQVFPNLDVQVKMSIESKDVLNPGTLTPTFTERTISGTARIQNNRTMMLASIAQDKQSHGRAGLPLLGLIPVFGRLFSTPRRDNFQTDIVIAVTPRVLRAPAVTPRDEEMRPSGTLQTPTTGSLEAMVLEADREDQLAAARRLPKNAVVQLPDAEPSYVPAPKSMITSGAAATTGAETAAVQSTAVSAVPANIQPSQSNVSTAVVSMLGDAPPNTKPLAVNTSSNLPRPVDLAAKLQALAAQPAVAPAETATLPQPLALAPVGNAPSAPSPGVASANVNSSTKAVASAAVAGTAELRLMPERQEMRVGEQRRIALVMVTSASVGPAAVRLRFDPRFIAVRGISQGDLGARGVLPTITQSIDPQGGVLVLVSPPAGGTLKMGALALLFVDIEAVAAGETAIRFDRDNTQLVAFDGRGVLLSLVESVVVVQ